MSTTRGKLKLALILFLSKVFRSYRICLSCNIRCWGSVLISVRRAASYLESQCWQKYLLSSSSNSSSSRVSKLVCRVA